MHKSAFLSGERFVAKYLNPEEALVILDIGSFNVNGTLKPCFVKNSCICSVCGRVMPRATDSSHCCGKPMLHHHAADGVDFRPLNLTEEQIGKYWQYFGVETRSACTPYGEVLAVGNEKFNVDIIVEDHQPLGIKDQYADVVVSTSCFEHDPQFWVTFKDLVRVVKTGGLLYINAPSGGPYHGYPRDCWRFYEDAWKALSDWCPTAQLVEHYIDTDVQMHGGWADNVGIFRIVR